MTGAAAQHADLKQVAVADVDRRKDQLLDVSHQIHAHPELCFEERFARDLLASVLEDASFQVERGAYGLETAFAARAGEVGPLVAVLCEYDALPGIGHACGHNIIAAAGLGAGLAAATVARRAGGRLVVLGTPAEERGAGKQLMADRGAFEDVSAALMVHPAAADLLSMDALAIVLHEVDYYGRSAHAAARPERGRNALDAAVLGYAGVAALRQHLLPSERVHGIFTKAGDAPNVVPAHTQARWMIRSPSMAQLEQLEARVFACLGAGAAAAGCRMERRELARGREVVTNPVLIDLFAANLAALGRSLQDPAEVGGVVGSTDMGHVSYLVPSIHPMIRVSPPDVSLHEPAFTDYAGSPEGDRAVLDGAKALAMTVIDLWTDPEALPAAWDAFERGLDPRGARGPGRGCTADAPQAPAG
jgi:amidohydrolase